MKTILKICAVILLLYLGVNFYGNYKKKKMLDNLNQSAMEDIANSIISSVEYARACALLTCSAEKEGITIGDVKEEFSGRGTIWNDNNTITSEHHLYDDLVCNVIVNSNNEMTVECDANGVKINSEPLSMNCNAYKNQN